MLWIAVENNEYELPLCVERSHTALARKLGIKPGTVLSKEYRDRTRDFNKNIGRTAMYKILQVEEIEDEQI